MKKTKEITITFDSSSEKEEFVDWFLEVLHNDSGFSVDLPNILDKDKKYHVQKASEWDCLKDF